MPAPIRQRQPSKGMIHVISYAPLYEGCGFVPRPSPGAEAKSIPGSSVLKLFQPVGKLKHPVRKVMIAARLLKYPEQLRPSHSRSDH